jgi:SAM-dependent methyltransferase
MPAEFDRYAAEGYSKLLHDPIRGRFAGAEFYFRRKLVLIREFCRQRGIETERADWLDVGCGDGGLLKMGQPYFRNVAGCDVSEGMLGGCEGLNVRHQDSPRRVPFGDQSFDIVTAVCVYHHVDLADRNALTADISRVLKPGGMLCVIEHNPFNPVTRLVVWRAAVDKHARLLTAGETRRLAQDSQMEILDTRYFLFFPERLYSSLAGTEIRLSSLPLGGQYAVFSRKGTLPR